MKELYNAYESTRAVASLRYLRVDDVESACNELRAAGATTVDIIGRSREGRPIHALTVGRGATAVMVKGNAHADEPAGTVSCLLMARLLTEQPAWRPLLDRFRFHLIPTANPDGLHRNAEWLKTPFDLRRYFLHVYRDLPRDDVEFGYPSDAGMAVRPENRVCARFFESCAPVTVHLSLHSMVFTGGAWFLVAVDEPAVFRESTAEFLIEACKTEGIPLHDEDRGGQRGFSRLRPGFHSIPTVEGMQAFYERSGNTDLVKQFRLNSMQYALRHCGARFAAVTELPLACDPALADMTPVDRPRAELEQQRITDQTASLNELDGMAHRLSNLPLTEDGAFWLDYARAYLDYRRSGLQSLTKDLDRYANQSAVQRDIHDIDMFHRRNLLFNAAAALRVLHDCPGDEAERYRLQYETAFTDRYDGMMSRFRLRLLPLEVQVRLQIAAVLAGLRTVDE